MSLRGKQKRFLRSQAHHLQPIFQIGKGGINSAMIVQIEEALEKRELIKVSLLQNTDEIAEEAAQV
ncbi:YhbY family RNA-binding protein, partial [Enterococcus faecium]